MSAFSLAKILEPDFPLHLAPVLHTICTADSAERHLMAVYKLTVSISSPPIDVSLSVAGHAIKLERDDTGCWAGTASLDLTSPAAIKFRAAGISSSAWTLTIKFQPTGPGAAKTYTHSDTIPDDELSDLTDQAILS